MRKRIARNLRIILRSGKGMINFLRLKIGSFLSKRFSYSSFSRMLVLGPNLVFIGTTFKCNFNCLFCLEHSPLEFPPDSPYYLGETIRQKEYSFGSMDYGLFKKIIDDIHDLGTRQVSLSGAGETLLHEDFIDMCRYLKSKGLKCAISTNGELLTRQISKSLIETGIDTLNVSLNAACPDTHKKINGLDRQAFQNVISNIEFLSSLKRRLDKASPKLTLSFVICKLNFFEIENMVRLAADLGIQEAGFWNFLYCRARKELLGHLLLDDNDILSLKELSVNASILAKKNRIRTNIGSFLKKLQQSKKSDFSVQNKNLRICQIQADSIVYPYDFPYEMGNVKKQPLAEIWYSDKYVNFRKSLLLLIKNKAGMPNLPFCRRCKAPFYDKELCTIQC